MAENCPYCGSNPDNFRSTNVLFRKDDQHGSESRSWWCFGSKKNDNANECADDSVIVGKYEKRRSTVAYTHRLSNFTGVKKKIQDVKSGYLMPPPKQNLKFLLVFNVVDLTCDALRRAAEKIGFEVTQCSTAESSYDEFQSKNHDLVVIDARSPKKLDYETLCRAIRESKGSQHAPIVAIVKKSVFEKDDGAILNLLENGFDRCILESSSVSNYINEIVQLKMNDMKSMAHKSTSQALYTALDKCNTLVLITDDKYKCQYANVNVEKCLKISQEDLVGKKLNDDILYDQAELNSLSSSLMRGREWDGNLTLRRRNEEFFVAHCRALSIACYGRLPTHFVMIIDPPQSSLDSASLTGGRRKSSDTRKSSLNKLMSLPLEAPITRIATLLDQVRVNLGDNTELIHILDKAEEILTNSELYSTQVSKKYRLEPEEPVVSDLITALLSNQSVKVPSLTSRRSSNDSVFRPSKVLKQKVTEIDELLETSLKWDFEIFLLEEITKHRPLIHLGMHLNQHFDMAASFQCDETTLKNWFLVIESHYHNENWYHNSTHAADVMQATAGFLETERMKAIMEPIDEAMCLIASAAHDVDHPGKSSAFLSNSDNPLAILYNDVTILENHHASCMFKLTLGDERVNIFKNLDRDTYKVVRHNIIDMILATEMMKHFEHLTKFVNVFGSKPDGEDDTGNIITLCIPDNMALIKRMLIKCSDVSNPTRPFRLYVEWARRIAEEYFQQTDEEKGNGMPVVMPMFDRKSCSVPKSQIGFMDYIVNDMFEAWNAFIDMPELITYLRQNYIRWKEFDENGHRTLADIRSLQSSALLAPVQTKSTIN